MTRPLGAHSSPPRGNRPRPQPPAPPPAEQQIALQAEEREMSCYNYHIYLLSHLCAADPPLSPFDFSLSISARASFMSYNVDKSHYGVCVRSGGSCIDYGDRQNAAREKGPGRSMSSFFFFALYRCSKLSSQLGSSSSPGRHDGPQQGVNTHRKSTWTTQADMCVWGGEK